MGNLPWTIMIPQKPFSANFIRLNMIKWVINSLRPIDASMHYQPRPSLIQIMACRLAGGKPLSEPILECCYLDPWEQTAVKS